MSDGADGRRPVTPEWLTLRSLCRKQGRMLYWLASEAGMAQKTLYAKMNNYPGYTWRQGEKEAIADAMNVQLSDIWPNGQADPAEPASGEVA